MTMTDWFPTCEVRTARDGRSLQKLAAWFEVDLTIKDGCDALTWFLSSEGQTPCAIVWVKEGVAGKDLYALIAHEATHCAMDYMKSICEDEFSSEFIAYTVQSFFLEICRSLGVE